MSALSKALEEMKEVNSDSRIHDVDREKILLIGNPGVGKSTISNSIFGKVVFRSGLSWGKGMTTICQEAVAEYEGQVYDLLDTPGLEDMELRKQAAEEIEKALKKGGVYRVFFVILLVQGRIRPSDKTTISLVLDACPDITSDRFGVIINQSNKRTVKGLAKEENMTIVRSMLFHDVGKNTRHIHVVGTYEELDGEDDTIMKLPESLKDFLLHGFTPIEVVPERVEQIKESDYDLLKEKLGAEIEELVKDKAKMQSMILEHKETMDRQAAQIEADRVQFENALKTQREDHAKALADMETKQTAAINEVKKQAKENVDNMQTEFKNQMQKYEELRETERKEAAEREQEAVKLRQKLEQQKKEAEQRQKEADEERRQGSDKTWATYVRAGSDKGSGAKRDLAYYEAPSGYYGFGHSNSAANLPVVQKDNFRPGRFSLCDGWEKIWDDRGSGNSKDYIVWMPTPKAGYVPMGVVCVFGVKSRDTKPEEKVLCVRKDLVKRSNCKEVWSDKGTWAKHDITLGKNGGGFLFPTKIRFTRKFEYFYYDFK